ncbi:MAG: hypothetical protein JO300_05575 [Silvibacterium sp.]|nr:hypothetical protein [Silvibacterium sp.]
MNGIFQFQSMITAVVNGISGSMLGSIQTVAYILMTIRLALGIFEAYIKGGDLRSLAATFLKYLVAAFVIGYWNNVFADTFTGFNSIARALDNSTGGFDLIESWSSGLKNLFETQGYAGIMKAIPWTPGALLTLVELALAYIIYPICTQIFTIIYTFWGSCLFAVGPFVIALAPSSVVNSLSKYYILNLAVWNAWTVLYAVFGCLISAIHMNVQTVANGNAGAIGFGTPLGGPLDGGIEAIGLISIIYAVLILLIPVVAAFVLRGQFSAVGAGLSMAFSRMTNGGIQGARAGAMAGPAGTAGGAAAGAGLGLMGVGTGALFTNGNSGSYGVPLQGMAASMPPPNTPPPDNYTRAFREQNFAGQ